MHWEVIVVVVAITAHVAAVGCGTQSSAIFGSFASPTPVPHNLVCDFVLSSPSAQAFLVTFTYWDLAEGDWGDRLEIWQGRAAGSDFSLQLMGSPYFYDTPPNGGALVVPGPSVTFRFVTNGANTSGGIAFGWTGFSVPMSQSSGAASGYMMVPPKGLPVLPYNMYPTSSTVINDYNPYVATINPNSSVVAVWFDIYSTSYATSKTICICYGTCSCGAGFRPPGNNLYITSSSLSVSLYPGVEHKRGFRVKWQKPYTSLRNNGFTLLPYNAISFLTHTSAAGHSAVDYRWNFTHPGGYYATVDFTWVDLEAGDSISFYNKRDCRSGLFMQVEGTLRPDTVMFPGLEGCVVLRVAAASTKLGLNATFTSWCGPPPAIADNYNLLTYGNNTGLSCSLAETANLNLNSTVGTVEVWTQLGAFPTTELRLVDFVGNRTKIVLAVLPAGQIAATIANLSLGPANELVVFSTPNALRLGVWHHIAVVHCGPGSFLIAVDGINVTDHFTVGTSFTTSTQGLKLASSSELVPLFLDDVRFWATARSLTKIQDNLFLTDALLSDAALIMSFTFPSSICTLGHWDNRTAGSNVTVPVFTALYAMSTIPRPPECGNRYHDAGETCDDGGFNANSYDFCNSFCQAVVPGGCPLSGRCAGNPNSDCTTPLDWGDSYSYYPARCAGCRNGVTASDCSRACTLSQSCSQSNDCTQNDVAIECKSCSSGSRALPTCQTNRATCATVLDMSSGPLVYPPTPTYAPYLDCDMIIYTEMDVAFLNFSSFDLGTGDFVEIYEDDSRTSLLGRFEGHALPLGGSYFVSSTGVFTVRFVSDDVNSGSGLAGSFYGMQVYAPSTSLTLPSGNWEQRVNGAVGLADGAVALSVAAGVSPVIVWLTRMDLGWDAAVMVFDGAADLGSPFWRSATGLRSPSGGAFRIASGNVVVQTAGTVDGFRTGVAASWVYPSAAACSGSVTLTGSTFINSSNPTGLPVQLCQWTAPFTGQYVKIDVAWFDTDSTSSLSVLSGSSLAAFLSGTGRASSIVLADTAVIQWNVAFATSHVGFAAQVTRLNVRPAATTGNDAVWFNSASVTVTCPTAAKFDNLLSFTAELWVSTAKFDAALHVPLLAYNTTNTQLIVAAFGNGSLTQGRIVLSAFGHTFISADFLLLSGVWHHVAASFDHAFRFSAAASPWTLTVDGAVAVLVPFDWTYKPTQSGFAVGGLTPYAALLGFVDEVRIWNSIRTLNDIRTNMYQIVSASPAMVFFAPISSGTFNDVSSSPVLCTSTAAIVVSARPTPQGCGNGMQSPAEECDDGNTVAGDGCSSFCRVEAGWVCPSAGVRCCSGIVLPANCLGVATCSNTTVLSCSGCAIGFYGARCNLTCATLGNCTGTVYECSQFSGVPITCSSCKSGFYGDDCSLAAAVSSPVTFNALTGMVSTGTSYAPLTFQDYVISVAGASVITLNFTAFQTQAAFDTLEIIDENDVSLGDFSGTSLPLGGLVYISGSTVLLRFDANSDGVVGKGFTVFYTATVIPDVAVPLALGPGYPFPPVGSIYGASVQASVNFTGVSNQIAVVREPGVAYDTSVVLDAGLGDPCFVRGFKLQSGSGFCVPGVNPRLEVAGDGHSGYGFDVEWFSQSAATCSGVVALGAGPATFDIGPYSTTACSWSITAGAGDVVSVTFNWVDIQSADIIQIYDGATNGAPTLLVVSGRMLPEAVVSSGVAMLIQWTPASSCSTCLGFSISYTTGTPGSDAAGYMLHHLSGSTTCSLHPYFELNNEFSVDMGVRPVALTGRQLLLTNNANRVQFAVAIDAFGRIVAARAASTTGSFPASIIVRSLDHSTRVAVGTWQHVAVTFDMNDGGWRMYLNGVPLDLAICTDCAAFTWSGSGLSVASSMGADTGLSGYVRSVHVWSVARSAPDVQAYVIVPLPTYNFGLIVSLFEYTPGTSNGGDAATSCATSGGDVVLARPTKVVAGCGNGIITPPETCDDGNSIAGDGCSSQCRLEPNSYCPGAGFRCCASNITSPDYQNCSTLVPCTTTGGPECTSCKPGNFGLTCNMSCAVNLPCTSVFECGQLTGVTIRCDACLKGLTGQVCQSNCTRNQWPGQYCNKVTECTTFDQPVTCDGCVGNVNFGPKCVSLCTHYDTPNCVYCTGGQCLQDSGNTTNCTTCKDGFRGYPFCQSTCSRPANCTGIVRCSMSDAPLKCVGGCKPGFWGTLCQNRCPAYPNCTGVICDQVTGVVTSCTSCTNLTVGALCDAPCTVPLSCNAPVYCTNLDAPILCPSCAAAKWGPTCAQSCFPPSSCQSLSSCSQATGAALACDSCKPGRTGTLCNLLCSNVAPCVTVTSCTQAGVPTQCVGCLAGYTGPDCSSACPLPNVNCTGTPTCSQIGVPISCPSCVLGSFGPLCNRTAVCGNGVIEYPEVCDGGPCCSATCSLLPSSAVCRAAATACDAAEMCTGASPLCPPNVFLPNTTACNDSNACTGPVDYCAGNSALCVAGATDMCCGDAVVQSIETCDDGNAAAGDGCSANCRREPGYSCLTPGQPCVACPAGSPPDCAGVCGGTAVVDYCGICASGSTGVVPNATLDACMTCGHNLVDLDACGVCFGGNRSMDACGVCFGNNATCAGCDGVPYSGRSVDVCGECGGTGSSCLGCDGVPVPLGGKFYDACGICGGTSIGGCAFGCDGVAQSASIFDCSGTCNGTASIDDCGVCTGGTTGRPHNMHEDNCGNCFQTCQGCASNSTVRDACGVCGGDGLTCAGCDGIPLSPKRYDACGVCGGTATSCILGCDGVPGSGLVFDCAGVCNGAATLDSCNICAGGNTGLQAGHFLDSCGVCFGGNRLRDSCGQCRRNDTDRDQCNVCFGHNVNLDSCGVCYGGNRRVDMCGVCFGNSTSCVGCDFIPKSGKVVDACGICGGNGASCVAPSAVKDSSGALKSFATYSFGFIAVPIIAAVVFVVVVLRRRKRKAENYLLGLAEKERAIAPHGIVTMVFTDIQGSTSLWEHYQQEMSVALDQHNDLIRKLIVKYNGYEVKTEGDAFRIAFHTAESALRFCMDVQLELLDVPWPEAILKSRDASVEYGFAPQGEVKPVLRRGIRVRMGMSTGEPEADYDSRAQRMDYRGPSVTLAQAVQAVANGGQILVSQLTYNDARDYVSNAGKNGISVLSMGTHLLKGVSEPVAMYQVAPLKLDGRVFSALKVESKGTLMGDTQRSQRTLRENGNLSGRSLDEQITSRLSEVFHGGAALSARTDVLDEDASFSLALSERSGTESAWSETDHGVPMRRSRKVASTDDLTARRAPREDLSRIAASERLRRHTFSSEAKISYRPKGDLTDRSTLKPESAGLRGRSGSISLTVNTSTTSLPAIQSNRSSDDADFLDGLSEVTDINAPVRDDPQHVKEVAAILRHHNV